MVNRLKDEVLEGDNGLYVENKLGCLGIVGLRA